MKQQFKYLLSVAASLAIMAVPSLALAATPGVVCGQNINTSRGQVLSGAAQTGNDCGAGVTGIISSVVQILSVVVGIVAVIMIIVAGFKYVTSSGDSGKVSSAKTTLVYALVGLAIAASAQLLTRFVLNSADVSACPSNAKILINDPACKTPPPAKHKK